MMTWATLAANIDKRPSRERLLILFTSLVMVYFIGFILLQPILSTQIKQLSDSVSVAQSQIESRRQEINQLTRLYSENTNEAKQAKITQLQQQISRINPELVTINNGLIEPQEMARVIEDILHKEKNLRLMHIGNLPAEPISQVQENDKADKKTMQIYKHGLALEFSGEYHNIIHFINTLESLPRRLFWGEFDLQKNEESKASYVRLVIYTISFSTPWLEM